LDFGDIIVKFTDNLSFKQTGLVLSGSIALCDDVSTIIITLPLFKITEHQKKLSTPIKKKKKTSICQAKIDIKLHKFYRID
jgi:hypothetical protein